MANISDLNPSDPSNLDPVSGGAQEIRDVKNALIGDGTPANGSFTPDFTGQYTGTADELNAIATSLQDGVSTLDQLADVAYLPAPANGDVLVWQNFGWLPKPRLKGAVEYAGYGPLVGDQLTFTNIVGTNTIPVELATVDNSGVGQGFTIEAVEDCYVSVSYWAGASAASTIQTGKVSVATGITRNPASTAFSADQGYDTTASDVPAGGLEALFNSTGTTTLLTAGDTLTVCFSTSNPAAIPLTPDAGITVIVEGIYA